MSSVICSILFVSSLLCSYCHDAHIVLITDLLLAILSLFGILVLSPLEVAVACIHSQVHLLFYEAS